MDHCLLCLEEKNEFRDYIISNSSEWIELNIKYVLEKYMWPMHHIGATSQICSNCWRELYEFHKFYIRTEEIHKNYGLLTQNAADFKQIAFDIEENYQKENSEIPINGLEENLVHEFENEYDVSNNLSQEELKLEEEEPLRKRDINENIVNENNPLAVKRKRGRPRKNIFVNNFGPKIPLNETKKYKKHKINDINNESNTPSDKTKQGKENKLNKIPEQISETIKESTTHDVKNSKVGQPVLTQSEDSNLSLDNGIDPNIDTDQELEKLEIKSSFDTSGRQKIKHNEKDRFLAENFKITCFLCNIPLETFFTMRKHFEEHHTERGHVKCCNKKFYRRSILVDHVHYHLNPNYFKCSQCGKVMADRRCLELHTETHEGSHEKKHCCDICGKGFAKLGVLKKHRMIHLSEEEKPFSCSDCGKNFASNYLLSSHYRTVHQKKNTKICDICGKSIRCKDVFERHMLQHEGKTAPSVSCDICGLLLTDSKALKRHKDIIHPAGGQHEYTCTVCSKTSPNLRAHKSHVQYKHIMGYEHKCTICNKAFKRAPTLKEHMASHTGKILYTCPWCPKTFNSNANMHNHRKKVHPKEWEEASRKRYSGNLPPNYKPPIITELSNFAVPLDV